MDGEQRILQAKSLLEKLKRDGIERKKDKETPINILAKLHFNLCKSVGGWVPHQEFLNMPLYSILELIRCGKEEVEEWSRKNK